MSSPAQQALILEWQSPDFATGGARLRGDADQPGRLRDRQSQDPGPGRGPGVATAALAFESVRNLAIFVAAAGPDLDRAVQRDPGPAAANAALARARAAAAPRPPPAGRWVPGVPARRRRPPAAMRRPPSWSTPDPAAARSPRAPPPPPAALRVRSRPGADHGGPAGRLDRGPPGAGDVGDARPSAATTRTIRSAPALAPSAPHDLRIFNQYGEGGYLSWSLAGTGDKIFIFGDAALMGDTILYTYADVADAAPRLAAILALRHPGRPLRHRYALDPCSRSPRWVLVYTDPYNQAFVLRGAGVAAPR